jgi:hypothetical protein
MQYTQMSLLQKQYLFLYKTLHISIHKENHQAQMCKSIVASIWNLLSYERDLLLIEIILLYGISNKQ